MLCREQRKRGQETKGCLGDSQEGGNSQETQSDFDACFLPLSLTISIERKVIACSGRCKDIVDTGATFIEGPGTLIHNIQKFIGATPQCAEVKHHAPGSLPVSTQNKGLQGQPLILSL